MKHNDENIILSVKKTVESIDPDAITIIHGSRARNEERVDSDWDFIIITNNPLDLELETKFRDRLYDLEIDIGQPFSFMFFSKDDWQNNQRLSPFYQNVIKDGISL